MKVKNNFFSLFVVFALLGLVFTGCSNDVQDNQNSNNGDINNDNNNVVVDNSQEMNNNEDSSEDVDSSVNEEVTQVFDESSLDDDIEIGELI